MGLYFEDFEASGDLVTRGRTVTDADIMAFAGLTGDFTELHTNEEFAKSTRFGRRIAHGALVFSLSMGLATRTNVLEDTLIAFAGVDKMRFVDPVLVVQVRFTEWTSVGNIRHPTFLGMRPDKDPSEVVREEPA